jgi:ankyrin repeat protein
MASNRRLRSALLLAALALPPWAASAGHAACEEAGQLAQVAAFRPVAELEARLAAGVPAEPAPGCLGTRSPLEVAAERGRTDVVRVLLAHGASVRRAPLSAAAHDDPELMGILIDALPEPERAEGLADALDGAATHGHVALIRMLLARGADPARDRRFALEYAAAGGHVEALRVLVGAGFEPADPRAFAAALAVGDVESVRDGLAGGADANTHDATGGAGNALSQLAAATGPARASRDLAIAEMLLERGVDPSVPQRGVLPLTLARERGNPALAERLAEAGAQEGTTFAWKLDQVGSALRGAGIGLVLLLGGGL